MKRNVGGRESFIENARQMCIVIGDRERAVIEQLKGDSSVSEFVRDSILMRAPDTDRTEVLKLRERTLQQAHELDIYKKKEHVLTKEREEVAAYIARDFELFKGNSKKAVNPAVRQRWLAARCRDTGVTPSDILCCATQLISL